MKYQPGLPMIATVSVFCSTKSFLQPENRMDFISFPLASSSSSSSLPFLIEDHRINYPLHSPKLKFFDVIDNRNGRSFLGHHVLYVHIVHSLMTKLEAINSFISQTFFSAADLLACEWWQIASAKITKDTLGFGGDELNRPPYRQPKVFVLFAHKSMRFALKRVWQQLTRIAETECEMSKRVNTLWWKTVVAAAGDRNFLKIS